MKISYFDLALIALDGALVGLNVGLAIHSFIDGKTGLGFFQLGAAVVIGVITAWMIFMTSQRIKIHRTTERLNAYSVEQAEGMKYVLMALGLFAALAIYMWVPRYLDEYEQRGTPPPYEGPKYYEYRNGVRVRL
jgi:hypothetical protein